jgi:two-component sensor histidine kinase
VGLSRFGIYDGIYLVDSRRTIAYMSGIAANMFRSISLGVDVQGQGIDELEPIDEAMYDEVMRTRNCMERRSETADGRVWVRKAVPIFAPAGSLLGTRFWLPKMRPAVGPPRADAPVALVLTLLHNATEAVQKQRELNVKAAIIQEVHHRVKNNLQTIAALLRMQARRAESEETRQALGDAVNRILTVAVIHEFHSQDEYRPINVREICQRIAQQVRDVAIQPDQEVEMQVTGPNIRLPAAQATPVAMVVNELILNAMEHGLENRKRGYIEVALNDLGDRVEISVGNSGEMLPPDFDAQRNSSLGLQIVHTLVTDDLKGELRFYSPWRAGADAKDSHARDSDAAGVNVASQDAAGKDAAGVNGDADAAGANEEDGESGAGACFMVTFPKRSLRVD